jgi:hypothetical protein
VDSDEYGAADGADAFSSGHLSELLAHSVEQQVAEQRALQTALAQVAAVLPRLGDLDPARLHATVRESVQQAVQDSVRQSIAAEVQAALAPLAAEIRQELAALADGEQAAARTQLTELAEAAADTSADAEETLEKVDALREEVTGLRAELVDGLTAVRAAAEGVRVDLAEATEGTRSSIQDVLQQGALAAPSAGSAAEVLDDLRDGLAGVRTDLDQMPPAVAAAVGGRLAEPLESLRAAIAASSGSGAPSGPVDSSLTAEVAALRRDLATLRLLLVEQPVGPSVSAGDGAFLVAVEARFRRHLDDAVVQLAALLLGVEAPPAEPEPEIVPPAAITPAPPAAPVVEAEVEAEAEAGAVDEDEDLEEEPWIGLDPDPADLGESAPFAAALAGHEAIAEEDVPVDHERAEDEPAEFEYAAEPEITAAPEPPVEPPVEPPGPVAAKPAAFVPPSVPFASEFLPYLNDESPYLNDEFEWQPLPPTAAGSPEPDPLDPQQATPAGVADVGVGRGLARGLELGGLEPGGLEPGDLGDDVDAGDRTGVDIGRAPRRSGGHGITGPIEIDQLSGLEPPPPDPLTVRHLPPPDGVDHDRSQDEHGEHDDEGKRRWWKRHAGASDEE